MFVNAFSWIFRGASLNRNHFILSALQSVSIFASLASQLLMAQKIGPGIELDSYFAAIGFAMAFIGSLGTGSIYLLPARIRADSQTLEHQKKIAGAGVVAVAALGIVAAIVSIILFSANSFISQQPHAAEHTIMLFGLAWGSAFASIVAAAWGAVGNSQGRVIGAITFGMVPPAAMASYLFGTASPTVVGMAGAQLVGICVQTMGLAWTYRSLCSFRGLDRKAFVRIIGNLPVAVAGAFCFSAYSAVDAWLAPSIGEGVMSHQALAQRLVIAFCAILSAGPFMLAASITANMLDEGRRQDAWKYTLQAAKKLILLCLVASAAAPWIGHWAISILFQRGAFGLNDTNAVSTAVTILLTGSGPMLATAVAFRVLHNTGNGSNVAFFSLAWVFLYATIAKLLSAWLGSLALSVAYVAAWSLISFAAYFNLSRSLK
jgi:putative peptidoglycan lipid II flippase